MCVCLCEHECPVLRASQSKAPTHLFLFGRMKWTICWMNLYALCGREKSSRDVKDPFSWAKHFILGADSCSLGLFSIFDPVKIQLEPFGAMSVKVLMSWHLSLTSRLCWVFLCSQLEYNFSYYKKRHVEAKVRDGDLKSSCIILLHDDLLTRNIIHGVHNVSLLFKKKRIVIR